jgi:hypothetical protein
MADTSRIFGQSRSRSPYGDQLDEPAHLPPPPRGLLTRRFPPLDGVPRGGREENGDCPSEFERGTRWTVPSNAIDGNDERFEEPHDTSVRTLSLP